MLISFFIFILINIHGYHLSQTAIDYFPEEKKINIVVHVNGDDLEKAIRPEKKNMKWCTDKEDSRSDSLIFEYINKHLTLETNQKRLEYRFLQKEMHPDQIGLRVDLVVDSVEMIQSLTISNLLLIPELEDQKNLIQVNKDGKRMGYFLLDQSYKTEMVLMQ